MGRHTTTLLLWVLAVCALVFLIVRGGPWIWPRLFPAEPAPSPAAEAPPSPEYVAEVLSRFLAGWGEHLPDGDAAIELPAGRRPSHLEAGLRREPRLGGLQIYVTEADELHHSLRVFSGPTLLLRRSVRPWLPDRPVLPAEDRPRLGAIVLLESEALVKRLGAWKAPIALALPPFAPHAAKTARQASWDGKGVLAILDSSEDLAEQSRALQEAGGVLVLEPLPEGVDLAPWLAGLAASQQFLVDRDGALEGAAASAGVSYLRLVATLGPDEDRRVTWALTQRRKRGLVLVEGDEAGLAALEEFVEASRDVGFDLRLPAEVIGGSAPPAAP